MNYSFKKFLMEAEVKPYDKSQADLDLSEVIKIAEENCGEYWEYIKTLIKRGDISKETGVIWRGMGNHTSGVYDPSTGLRKSQNTSNQYTSIFSTNPANEKWPKRNQSFICSTNFEYASSYGSPYLIIPFENVKIGVVLADDLHTLEPIEDMFYYSLNCFIEAIINNKNPTFDELKSELEKISNKPDLAEWMEQKTSHVISSVRRMLTRVTSSKESFETFKNQLLDIYTFSDNPHMFHLLRSASDLIDYGDDYPDNELWFAGKCLVIPYDDLKYMF